METESSLQFCAEDMRNNLPQYQIVPHIVSSTGLFRKVNLFIQHQTCAQYPDGVSHEKYWDTNMSPNTLLKTHFGLPTKY